VCNFKGKTRLNITERGCCCWVTNGLGGDSIEADESEPVMPDDVLFDEFTRAE
jgi:hypothetical protein